MVQQIPLDAASVSADEAADGSLLAAPDIAYQRHVFVNTVMLGQPGQPDWVLVDAGIPGTAGGIEATAAARFGNGRPRCILMTHGHFDHVGALEALAARWNVPIHAHPAERPYLDGSSYYPKADPSVGGGMMALLSPLYPRSPVDVGRWLQDLPADGSVPGLPDWRWVHTPGHSVGHVSFWRERDRALVVGDAFVTVAGESAYATAVQDTEMHGPPKYFTHDWQAAERSVAALAALEPEVAVTGHGRAVHGPALRAALHDLSRRFRDVAVPTDGHYVQDPQRAEDGSAYKPS